LWQSRFAYKYLQAHNSDGMKPIWAKSAGARNQYEIEQLPARLKKAPLRIASKTFGLPLAFLTVFKIYQAYDLYNRGKRRYQHTKDRIKNVQRD